MDFLGGTAEGVRRPLEGISVNNGPLVELGGTLQSEFQNRGEEVKITRLIPCLGDMCSDSK